MAGVLTVAVVDPAFADPAAVDPASPGLVVDALARADGGAHHSLLHHYRLPSTRVAIAAPM